MKARRERAGFSLLEMLVALGVATVILGMLVQTTRATGQLTSTALSLGRLEEAASQALLRVDAELRWARPDTLLITTANGSDRIDLVIAEGYDGTDTVWSAPIVFQVEPSAEDANGNGIADEGELVRLQGGTRRVLCRNVSPGGFAVVQDEDRLDVQLTTFQLADGPRLVTGNARTSVTLVNRLDI